MCEHMCARVNLSQELQAGLLTVVEQVPGLTVAADKTATLERGYWPSKRSLLPRGDMDLPLTLLPLKAAWLKEFFERQLTRRK